MRANSLRSGKVADLGHNSKAHVHIIRPNDGGGFQRLKCFRCERQLPEAQFGVVSRSFILNEQRNRDMRNLIALHPLCFTCRKQAQGKWTSHPLYTAGLDRYWSKRTTSIRTGAQERGILFAIEKEDLLGKYLEQDGKCALSGLQLGWPELNGSVRGQRYPLAPSVDRIDSSGNYTLDNIQIVAAAINTMKSDLKTHDFVHLCRLVTKHVDRKREAEVADLVLALG
jgi:hypothetical protein